jgi:hypothetical protein
LYYLLLSLFIIYKEMAKSKIHIKPENKGYLDYGLGSWLKGALTTFGDVTTGAADALLSQYGMGNIIGDNMYSSKTMATKSNDFQSTINSFREKIPMVGGIVKGLNTYNTDQTTDQVQQGKLDINNKAKLLGQDRLVQYNQQQMLPTFDLGGNINEQSTMKGYGYNLMPNGGYIENPAWYQSNALSLATGGHLPEGNATLKEAKEFLKLYPEEMTSGTEVEYEHTGNKKLAQRIAADHVKDSLKINQGGAPDYYKKLQEAGISDELNRMPQMQMGKGGFLSVDKAKKILEDGTIKGKALTERQKRYFGFIAGGGKPSKVDGGILPSFGTGGMLDNIPSTGAMSNDTTNNPTIFTEYKGGGTHESSALGGIPLGGKARVEEGEVRYDDSETGESYIFSNRLYVR